MISKYIRDKYTEKFWVWLAWLMPRSLVKWCAVRLMVAGTLNHESPAEVQCATALKRWQ